MKLTRCKKIFLIIALTAFVVLLFSSNTAFAAINTEYSGTDTVPDTNMEEAFSNSNLLSLLAKLIYAVGRFLEWILGTIFKLLTGSSDFPWADKIVFNAVPLLDVNFINPGAGSFVAQGSIQDVLKNLYATILTLAATFFGIVVLVTAIKLVISTIASDKAKYKQAIVDWLIGFVMLFCIHYAISFIFYLNEQLVVVASKIVTTQLADKDEEIVKIQNDTVGQEIIKNIEARGFTYLAGLLRDNPNVLMTYMNLKSNDESKGLHELLTKNIRWHGYDTAIDEDEQYRNLEAIISWAVNENVSVGYLQNVRNNIGIYSKSEPTNLGAAVTVNIVKYAQSIKASTLQKIFNSEQLTRIQTAGQMLDKDGKLLGNYFVYQRDGDIYITGGAEKIDKKYKGLPLSTATQRYYWTDVLDDMIKLKGASNTSGGKSVADSGKAPRLISDLASYFRYNAYSKELRTTNKTGLKDGGNIQIQNMIMYAILVAQSLILFISYVKRLFYVILLAMMAPVVVVFDFLQKFGR